MSEEGLSIAQMMRRMAELGAPMEAILIAVEAIEAAQSKDDERKRKDRERKRAKAADLDASEEFPRKIHGTGAEIPPEIPHSTPSPKERSPTPPKEITPSPSSLRSVSVHAREAFAEFWQAYPKREGSNPRKPAEDKFIARVRSGVDPASIIDGARAYAASMAGNDPRYVAQAVTWLNQERWKDEHRPPTPPRPPPRGNAPRSYVEIAQQLIEEENRAADRNHSTGVVIDLAAASGGR